MRARAESWRALVLRLALLVVTASLLQAACAGGPPPNVDVRTTIEARGKTYAGQDTLRTVADVARERLAVQDRLIKEVPDLPEVLRDQPRLARTPFPVR